VGPTGQRPRPAGTVSGIAGRPIKLASTDKARLLPLAIGKHGEKPRSYRVARGLTSVHYPTMGRRRGEAVSLDELGEGRKW
jgi:hypothetical protein